MTVIALGLIGLVVAVLILSRMNGDETVTMPSTVGSAGEAASVESLVLAGRKIEAIKQLREEKGLGLREAKEEVDAMMRRLRPS